MISFLVWSAENPILHNNKIYMKHNKYVPIIRIKSNEIKDYPKYQVIMEAQEDMFSEYDKIGEKSKILYKVYDPIKRAHTSFSKL